MATPLRTSPKAARTRAAILEAAESRFAEQGFDATRLEDVAEEVGIRRASIVYYFRDKRALYDEVLSEVFGGFLERIRRALGTPGSPEERIEAAVGSWVDFVGERPALARLLLREIADARRNGTDTLRELMRPFVDLIQELREEVREHPLRTARVTEPVHLASTIAGATVFFVVAIPTLLPELGIDPLDPKRLEMHRREVLGIARRLLGIETGIEAASTGRRRPARKPSPARRRGGRKR